MFKAHQRYKQRTLWRHKRHIGHMTHFSNIVANDLIYPTLVQTLSHCMRYLSIILSIKTRMIISKNATAHDHSIVSKISCRLCRSDCLTFEHFLVWIKNKYATGRSNFFASIGSPRYGKKKYFGYALMLRPQETRKTKNIADRHRKPAHRSQHTVHSPRRKRKDHNIQFWHSAAVVFLSRLPNFLNLGEVKMQSRSFNYRLQFLMNPQSSCKSRLTKQKVRNSRRKQV